jgi:cell division protein ZapA
MKQLEVQIMGQSYLLGCPEGGEARLLDAVERVDTAMCRIRDAGKVRARERIAVLAALNLAFDLSDRGTTTEPAPLAEGPAMMPSAFSPLAASGSGGTTPTASNDAVNPALTALLSRLDNALGTDGQLL